MPRKKVKIQHLKHDQNSFANENFSATNGNHVLLKY